MTLDEHWFSEAVPEHGVAFSLRVTEKLYAERTPYQCIEVFNTTHWGRLLTIDGCIMLTGRDNFIYHEMLAHPPMFVHPRPRRVLIIGGGDCGTLREVLRHQRVERAVQVEIDAGVTRAAERFFPDLVAANGDPRAELHYRDGVAYLKECEAASFDCIIIDSTDPVGIAEGLFAPAFLTDAYRVLAEPGILVQQSESPLLHADSIIAELHAALDTAGFGERVTLPFPLPSYPSGWWSATMAGKGLRVDEPPAEHDNTAGLATRYYTAGVHRGALSPPAFCAALFQGDAKYR